MVPDNDPPSAPKIISAPNSVPGDIAVEQADLSVAEKQQSGIAVEAPKEQVSTSPAPGETGGTKQSDTSYNFWTDKACKCCSLKRTILLGDSMPDEEYKFGDRTTDSYGAIARAQVVNSTVQIFQQVLLATPFVVFFSVLCALPVNGNVGATGFTVAASSALLMSLNMSSLLCPVILTDRHRSVQYFIWMLISMMPVIVGNTLVKWNMMVSGIEDTSNSQFWLFPPGFAMAIAFGKMHTVPGWYPKWNTCWCVCGGLSKAIGTCVMYYFSALAGVLVLTNFIYYDSTLFSLNESLTMAIVRPIMFTTIKKLVWAIFSVISWLRHPFLVKATTIAASAVLGLATAVAFTKTRTWTALVLFIVVNWFAHLSRMWVFLGGRFSANCFLFEWYKKFMVTGKPISSGKMKLRELRGFENMGQSWGTTFGMGMFIVFFPIVKIAFGDDSMPRRFFFPTDLSIIFLVIAYLNEVVLDVHTQVTTVHGTKSDYAGLFALKSGSAMVWGALFLGAFVGVVTNTAWYFERIHQEDRGAYGSVR